MMVGGKPWEGGGVLVPRVYPATGQVTAEVRLASVADVDAAVAAARKAAPGWRALTGDKRRDLMFRLAALIEQNSPQLAQISAVEKRLTIVTTRYLRLGGGPKVRSVRWLA